MLKFSHYWWFELYSVHSSDTIQMHICHLIIIRIVNNFWSLIIRFSHTVRMLTNTFRIYDYIFILILFSFLFQNRKCILIMFFPFPTSFQLPLQFATALTVCFASHLKMSWTIFIISLLLLINICNNTKRAW